VSAAAQAAEEITGTLPDKGRQSAAAQAAEESPGGREANLPQSAAAQAAEEKFPEATLNNPPPASSQIILEPCSAGRIRSCAHLACLERFRTERGPFPIVNKGDHGFRSSTIGSPSVWARRTGKEPIRGPRALVQ
jgi:hypothetical protein